MKASHLIALLFAVAVGKTLLAKENPKLHLVVDLTIERVLLSEARVLVMQEDRAAVLMEDVNSIIDFKFDLGTAYLIEFQRPGCVSRQLMVDTRLRGYLPKDDLVAFVNMLLEVPKKGQNYEFDGPVGYIYFNQEMNAFRFHTDYTVVGERSMIDRMAAQRMRFPLPEGEVQLPKTVYVPHPGYEYGTKVLTGNNAPPKIHRTVSDDVEYTKFDTPTLIQNDEVASLNVEPMENKVFDESEPMQGRILPARDERTTTSTLDNSIPFISEEMTITSSRIVKEVTVVLDGVRNIYRKVTDRNGTVFYFKNGISCTQLIYEKGIAPSAPSAPIGS